MRGAISGGEASFPGRTLRSGQPQHQARPRSRDGLKASGRRAAEQAIPEGSRPVWQPRRPAVKCQVMAPFRKSLLRSHRSPREHRHRRVSEASCREREHRRRGRKRREGRSAARGSCRKFHRPSDHRHPLRRSLTRSRATSRPQRPTSSWSRIPSGEFSGRVLRHLYTWRTQAGS